jgi:acyl carrier protein
MEEKLIALVAATLGVDPSTLTLDTEADAIEKWDSVAQINIVSEIEEQFRVSIPIEIISELHTIRDFLPYLGTKS